MFPRPIDLTGNIARFELPLGSSKVLKNSEWVFVEAFSGWRHKGSAYRLYPSDGTTPRTRQPLDPQPQIRTNPFAKIRGNHVELDIHKEYLPPQYAYDMSKLTAKTSVNYEKGYVYIVLSTNQKEGPKFYADEIIESIGGLAPKEVFLESRYPVKYACMFIQQANPALALTLSEAEDICRSYASKHKIPVEPIFIELADRYRSKL